MVTIVSRPTGGECGVGGCRGGVGCSEAIVSGLWCRVSSCGGPLCRGYVKNVMVVGFGGGNGR